MPARAQSAFSVAAFGIPDAERQVLVRILGLSASRANAYQLVESGTEDLADIMLLDRENRSAVAEWRRAVAAASPRRPGTIIIAREAPDGYPFHVRRPFMATRVLGTLDKVVAAAKPYVATGSAPDTAGAPPVEAPAAPTKVAADSVAPEPEAAPSTKEPDARYRALVVDDSSAVRKQIAMALQRADINADFADGGEKALALLDASSYDIVFLDVVMPGIDGYEVCKTIKRSRERRHIPVVMLTGRSSPFDKVKGKLSGCDTYLTKPVKGSDFMHTLKKYLKEPIAFE